MCANFPGRSLAQHNRSRLPRWPRSGASKLGSRGGHGRAGVVLIALLSLVSTGPGTAAEGQTDATAAAAAAPDTVSAADYGRMVDRAIEYLRVQGQAADGSFNRAAGPGVTALVTTAILKHGRSVDDPLVAKALTYLEGFVQSDGGIHAPDTLYGNYETCLALMCLSEANRDGRYQPVIDRARAYLKGIQWDESEGLESSDLSYGGAGYGSHRRPDLSNTAFLIETLRATGSGPDDPALERALLFVSRCQNLETPHNVTPFATKNPDGGFYYTCAAGGSSQAGETATGGLRSYASMTYAGLKSMIYAGVDADDPRVQAALQWIAQNYSLSENPGMGQSGLFYYYHTFAKALEAVDQEELVDRDGQARRWREDLVRALRERQHANGSWTNSDPRWLEGDPSLVTGYALLALASAKPSADHPR